MSTPVSTPVSSNIRKRRTLCYPLSAALILLSNILADPAAKQVEADVKTVGQFVEFLKSLQSDGCDVRRLLDGCTRLYETARHAVTAYKTDGSLIWDQRIASSGMGAQSEVSGYVLQENVETVQLTPS